MFVSKTSLRHVFKMSSRRLQCNNVSSSKTSWKTKNCYAEDVLKTSWRPTNACWVLTFLKTIFFYDNLVPTLSILSFFCGYKSNISGLSTVFHCFSKDWIIHQLKEVFLKIIFCLCLLFGIHVNIWFQPSFLIEYPMHFFQCESLI